MTDAVIFPDVEALLLAYLKPLVAPVKVVTKVPAARPASFVKLVRVGGPRRDRVTDRPMVVFQAWGPDSVAASELARRVHAHVYALAQTSTPQGYVSAVNEVGGLQYFPDPESGQDCYQFTAQLQTRGVPL
ncbi:hypothetical protein [Promicromonospora kroppenstedtii]|uniref:hypothetical protein n=2 Tax=Promicromonospora kroppenstedtii TaxID=440482 RepID=UPI0004BB0A50|nr:hypothetical protein [Promicromonospora kroppenstedtii]